MKADFPGNIGLDIASLNKVFSDSIGKDLFSLEF